MFARLGRWCYDHRWKVILLWVAALFVANGVLAGAGGAQTNADFTLPGFESAKGLDIIEESNGGQGSGSGGSIVFRAENGVDDPEVQEQMEAFFADVAEVDGIVGVSGPYVQEGMSEEARQAAEQRIATQGPDAGNIAFASVDFDPDLDEADFTSTATDVRDLYNDLVGDDEFVGDTADSGIQVELGGQSLAEFETPNSELLGVAFAVFILILAFGSVLAMGLPIGVAVGGIFAGTTVAGFLSFIFHPPSFASIFGLMIGLGVGIDYALFIVTRYRENLHAGHDTRSSVAIAIDTAGRAVIFAGTTVVISMLSMTLMGLSFVTGMAIAIATVVAMTMVASVTLLPALLGFAGLNIEVTRRRGLIAAGFLAVGLIGAGLEFAPLTIGFLIAVLLVLPGLLASIFGLAGRRFSRSAGIGRFFDRLTPAVLRQETRTRPPKPRNETAAYRWSRVIQHHPWITALAGTAILLVLALPLLGLRLGASDESTFPEDSTTRRAYEMLADGFGPGYNGPIMLVSELPGGTELNELGGVTDAIRGTEGVDFATDAIPTEDGSAVMWQVYPTTAPQNEATTQTVNRLRDDVLPEVTEGTDLDILATGNVAINVDFTDYLSQRLPYFLGAVLVLSFLLLMAVFRSLLVPLKAVIMNLLSIGAAYGVMVAGFQWGWLGGLLNFDKVPIEPWMPMMLFAIVFGLSMDYEVFLLSRVREEWLRTRDSRTSVADGLAVTARVITAAALIMVFVFGAFLLEDQTVVKLMGVGLATAVLLDATVVRMLLVPATMELLGDRNWWLPKWLDRLLPKIDVEGGHEAPPADAVVEDREYEPV